MKNEREQEKNRSLNNSTKIWRTNKADLHAFNMEQNEKSLILFEMDPKEILFAQ